MNAKQLKSKMLIIKDKIGQSKYDEIVKMIEDNKIDEASLVIEEIIKTVTKKIKEENIGFEG